MKKITYLIAALIFVVSCAVDVEPLTFTAPEVEFFSDKADISVSVGEPQTFSATVLKGEGLTLGWYVDGVLESSGGKLVYTWDEPGISNVRFQASNGAGSVEKEYTVTVTDVLEIFISSQDEYEVKESINCLEQSHLQVYAVVTKGSNVSHQWTVDGEIQDCKSAYFADYWIDASKQSYQVNYRGTNSVGTVEKNFTVNVVERPLTVEFSEKSGTIVHNYTEGKPFELAATVLFGGSGIRHKWYKNETLIGEDAKLSVTFDAPAEYIIKYSGENAKGEKVEQSWKLMVIKRTEVLLEDYENGIGNGVFVQQSGGQLSVVDNPVRDALNSSSKVLKVTGGGSGYFGFVYDAVAKLGIDITQYDGIKVEMYIEDTRFYPVMDYTGMGKVKANADTPYEYKKWVTLDYDLNFSTKAQMQPRPFVDEKGNGKGSNSVVYYDNIYLYKK